MARPTSRVRGVRIAGPLAPFADAYKAQLKERGYTPLTVEYELRQLARLSRWLEDGGLRVADVTSERLDQFVVARRATAGSRACSLQSLAPLLEILGSQGLIAEAPPAGEPSASEAIVALFQQHLFAERGLAASTVDAYAFAVRRFLAWYAPDGSVGELTTADVTRAVARESMAVSVGSVRCFIAGLRAFLRFCFIEGLVGSDLSAAALSVTGRRVSPLPKGISQSDAEALLRSCDRRRPTGRRDYAVIITLLRLGLRAGELAALKLDDIDWRAADIVVHGKGRRIDRLPVPVDVGEAVAGYLRRGRPRTTRRELFLRAVAPVAPLGRRGVSNIVRRACLRAGMAPIGAHRLRHTMACAMVTAGVSLPEIGDVLRQRNISSTAIYARVDVEGLRSVALPWPGEDGR